MVTDGATVSTFASERPAKLYTIPMRAGEAHLYVPAHAGSHVRHGQNLDTHISRCMSGEIYDEKSHACAAENSFRRSLYRLCVIQRCCWPEKLQSWFAHIPRSTVKTYTALFNQLCAGVWPAYLYHAYTACAKLCGSSARRRHKHFFHVPSNDRCVYTDISTVTMAHRATHSRSHTNKHFITSDRYIVRCWRLISMPPKKMCWKPQVYARVCERKCGAQRQSSRNTRQSG